MVNAFLLHLLFLPLLPSNHKTTHTETKLFDKAVACIKKYEGWHDSSHYPYVGYGHRLLKEDKFNHIISEALADSLLRKDLLQKCAQFRKFGKDSLLLGVLAYNTGEYKLLGHGKQPKSGLIRKLEQGNRKIYHEYVSYCRHRGRVIPSLRKRREEEYRLLFINNP